MSFKRKPQVTVNDPYKDMPAWVRDYYQNTVAGTMRSDQRADAVRAAFEANPDAMYAPFTGNESRDETNLDIRTMLAEAGVTGDRATAGLEGFTLDGLGDLEGIDERLAAILTENDPILNVLDPVMSRMRENEARAMADAEGRAAAVGGSGNTRMAVEMARIGSEGMRDRAEVEAQLRSDALRNRQDVTLRTEDARAGLVDRSAAMARSLADTLLNRAGLDTDRSTARLGLGAFDQDVRERERVINTERRQAPMAIEQWFRSLQGTPAPVNLPNVTTQTTTGGGPGLGSQLLGAATSIAGAIFSDEQVKDDIETMDGDRALEIIRAQRPSVYRYIDPALDRVPVPGRRSAGLMAQDLEDIPGAVIENDAGVKMVDPYPVMATIAAALQRLDQRVEDMRHG